MSNNANATNAPATISEGLHVNRMTDDAMRKAMQPSGMRMGTVEAFVEANSAVCTCRTLATLLHANLTARNIAADQEVTFEGIPHNYEGALLSAMETMLHDASAKLERVQLEAYSLATKGAGHAQ
jgi:hypothetical protein